MVLIARAGQDGVGAGVRDFTREGSGEVFRGLTMF